MQDLHYPIPFTDPTPSLLQDFCCCCTYNVVATALSRDLNCYRTSNVAGSPLLHDNQCQRTTTLKITLLFKHVLFHSNFNDSGCPMSQDLHCCSSSTVAASPLVEVFHCHSFISTVSGPPVLEEFQCCFTSNFEDFTVASPPLLLDLHCPTLNSIVSGLPMLQDQYLTFSEPPLL